MEQQSKDAPGMDLPKTQAQLRRLEWREWWLWSAACFLMLLLTLAVASSSLPELLRNEDSFWQLQYSLAAHGLLGLVLLFIVYTSYQQFLLKQFRRRLAEQVVETTRLEVERKRTEELLRLSEDRFSKAFHSSPDAMTISNLAEGRYLEVNDAFLQMVGYEKQEVLGRTTLELGLWVNPSHREKLLATLQKKRKLKSAEFLFRTKAGDIRYGLLSAQVIEVAGERCLLGAIRDCTEQRMAEEAVRSSEERYRNSERELRSLVDNAPYGIYRSSVETGRFVSVNPAMVQMLGYKYAEELLALDLARDVYRSPEDRAKVVQALRSQGSFHDLELLWRRKDGSDLVVRTSGRIAREPSGNSYLEVIAEDVTERRLLEQQFRQAQKMEAIGQLAGGVAHDFNNLLMAISSFTELAGDAGPTNEKQQRYLQEVLKATRRAAGLTQQLLAFSRKQVLAPSLLDLNHIVQDFSKMLPPLIGEHIEVRIVPKAKSDRVEADRGQIEQIIMNLAVNARHAMPKGGTLVVEVKDAVFDQPHLGPNYTIPPGSYVMLAVSDNGAGMDAETQAHIFEPFFTTKERGKGTGLGLATVYGIVKQSGGYISVYSEKGVGTTFRMYFPRAEKALTADRTQVPAQAVAGGSETILLVEDEQAVRFAAREFLETKGYTVLDAGNAPEALQSHAQHVGPVHLLITDVVMPGMNGRELAERLRQLDPGLQVLYVSGYTDGAIASVAGLEKEAGFLQKPFALEALAQTVRSALDAAHPQKGAG